MTKCTQQFLSFGLLWLALISSGKAQEFEAVFEILADQLHANLSLTQPPSLSIQAAAGTTWTITSIETIDNWYNDISEYIVITKSIAPPRAPPQCIPLDNQSTNANYDVFCVFVDDASNISSSGGNSSKCKACIPGFTINNEGEACTACQPGFYKTNYGIDPCIPCAAGWSTVGFRGQTYCWPCAAGSSTMGATGQGTCTQCAPNSEALVAGTPKCTCVLGASLDYTGNECVPCPAGTYAKYAAYDDGGTLECTACGAGMFSSARGVTSCDFCLHGTYAAIGGLSACLNCAINTTSTSISQTSCETCANGTYTLHEGSSFCLCAAGMRPSLSANYSRCQPCDPGFFQPISESEAANDITGIACMHCGPGTYNAQKGQPYCMECPIGKYESAQGSTSCSECGPFSTTVSPAKTSENECKCIPGSTQDISGKLCIPCPVGFYQNYSDSGECLACTGYSTNLAVGSTTCDSCLAGSLLQFATNISGGGSTIAECKPCRPGFYQPIPRQTQCLQCPAGSFSNSAGSTYCNLCAQDSFASVDGSAGCSPCPPYSETGGVSGSTRCACTLGSSISIFDTCVPCPAGSFQAQRGGPCQPCAAGTITPNTGSSGALACVPCAQGTFAASAGLSTCAQCPMLSDTRERVGASSCTCISGTAIDYFENKCIECIPGYYHTSPLEHCFACPGGHYSNVSRSTACIQCPQGMYSQSTSGSTTCVECKGGSITSQNQTSCTCSEALQMFNQSKGPDGWKCADCTPSCDHTTSYLAQACNPNQDTLCKKCSLECPSGRYLTANCTSTQDIICKPCSQTCSMGYFIESQCSRTADITCVKCASTCPTKRFAATEACTYTHDLICSLCPPGTYVKDTHLCADCLDGSASSSLDDSCVLCGQGFYSNPNKTLCVKQCPPNSYPSSSRGCSECPPLSGGNGMGCYYTQPTTTPEAYTNISYNTNSSLQICKPDFTFNITKM